MNTDSSRIGEIDFKTFGITIEGELYRRACAVLVTFPGWNDTEFYSRLADDLLMRTSLDLVRNYEKCQQLICRHDHTETWEVRAIARMLMNNCLKHSLPAALELRAQIEHAAKSSELHSVALDVIREYESYCANEETIRKHKTEQEKIFKNKREEFLTALEDRDGAICKGCGSEDKLDNLTIDHELPLILGGLSVLDNLQLLCGFCNGRKNDRPMEYLLRRKKKIALPSN